MKLAKKTKAIMVVVAALTVMTAAIPLAIWITHTSEAELGNGRARCARTNQGISSSVHTVLIQNDRVTPRHIAAKKCDTLIITNLDSRQRLMAFGKHNNHISYDGISEKLLSKDQSLKVTLIKSGTYLFHDHADDSVSGTFTVQ